MNFNEAVIIITVVVVFFFSIQLARTHADTNSVLLPNIGKILVIAIDCYEHEEHFEPKRSASFSSRICIMRYAYIYIETTVYSSNNGMILFQRGIKRGNRLESNAADDNFVSAIFKRN